MESKIPVDWMLLLHVFPVFYKCLAHISYICTFFSNTHLNQAPIAFNLFVLEKNLPFQYFHLINLQIF